MRNAMKKFVAVVLTLAMVLSTMTVAFAAPGTLADLDVAHNVSLNVHHSIIPIGATSPGATPAPVTLAQPAVGSLWRMVRVVPPAGWLGEGTAPNLTLMPPANVQNAITSGASTLPGGWAFSSDEINAVSGANGVATFPQGPVGTANTIRYAVDGFTGNAAGHGIWFVWECSTSAFQTNPANAEHGLANPFLVSLPHFLHYEDTSAHAPVQNPPGQWLYTVNVFIKPEVPPTFVKNYVGSQPEELIIDGVARQVSRLDWQISVGIHSELSIIPPVNADPPGAPGGLAHAGVMTQGQIPAGATYILVRDVLDYRTRLVDFELTAGALVTTDRYASFDLGFTSFAAGAFVRRPLPVGAAGSRNYYVMSHILTAGTTTASLPAAMLSSIPAARITAGALNEDMQVFWLHITQLGRNYIAEHGWVVPPAPATNPAAGVVTNDAAGNLIGRYDTNGVIDIRFSVIAEWDTVSHEDLDTGEITNTATLNHGRDPAFEVSNPPDERTSTQGRLTVNKINLSGQDLDGAVFFMWRQDQVEYILTGPGGGAIFQPTPTAPTPPAAGANQLWVARPRMDGTVISAPARRAVSGGIALSAADAATRDAAQSGPTVYPGWTAPGGNLRAIAAIPAMPGPALDPGQTMFTGLDPGYFYLFERLAPEGGYRRVDGLQRIYIPENTSAVGDAAVSVEYNAVNTREFELPLTGGAGTIMFTAAGVSLMGGAGLFLFLARKKEKAQK